MSERYIAESFRGRWFVTDTETSTIMTDVATGEDTARAAAADMNRNELWSIAKRWAETFTTPEVAASFADWYVRRHVSDRTADLSTAWNQYWPA